MNNLKRVLSLGLSGVMLSGMMAMGAGAADFTDADEIQHQDAVNVLVALNVVNGKEDGSFFDPTGDVKRGEMAKMIAVAMNGGTDANTGVKGTASFTDIKGHWAESYIEYCYDLGIISGRGDGTFDPDGKVTGLEATKMVLTALGYDATAYRLTGSSWAVRTDELARAADPSLYEDLTGVVMANNATREVAAQIIWNGMQNMTKRVTPSTNTSTGEVTWSYGDGKGTLLKERYDANIVYGTYTGNSDTTSAAEEGEIVVYDAENTATYYVPSDLDISNIGEEVKVIWKDGKDSKDGTPDNKDTIYGVFNTGKTNVVWTTRNDVQNHKVDEAEIKVSGKIYKLDTNGVSLYKNYNTGSAAQSWNNSQMTNGVDNSSNSTITNNLKGVNGNELKLIFDENKLTTIYEVEYKMARVTNVSSSKVTLNAAGVGSISIDDNDIYEDIAKDDVVVFTRFYNDSDKDKAFFTVRKAETVEGEVDGFKKDSGNYENIVVDGETYKFNNKPASINGYTDDAIDSTNLTSSNIGDEVRLYMVNGFVEGIEALDVAEKNWAVLTDLSTSGTLTSTLDPIKATVLYADGEEETLALHKDSVVTTGTPVNTSNVHVGDLVQYTISGGKLKITKAIECNTSVSAGTKVYDKDTKKVSNGTNTYVAAADAVVFVAVSSDATIDNGDDFYAYDLRSLNNINGGTNVKVALTLNDNNQVKALVVLLDKKPTGATSNTVYGIVNTVVGTRKIDDETYNTYIVASNDDEITINIPTGETLAKGDIVTFDQTNDDCYDSGKVTKVVGTYGAVNNYNASKNLLSYYANTVNVGNDVYEGRNLNSITVDDDATIVYIDADNNTSTDGGSISKFDVTTGKHNILFTTNSDGLVDVIIVETSGEGFSVTATGASIAQMPTNTLITLPAGTDITGFTGVDENNVEKVIFVNFTTTAANQGVKCEITDNADSGTVYTSTGTLSNASGDVKTFYLNIFDDKSGDTSGATWTKNFEDGHTYTLKITETSSSNTLAQVTFTR